MTMPRLVLRRADTECGGQLGLRTRRPQSEFESGEAYDDSAI
jgi:hypothetical protein